MKPFVFTSLVVIAVFASGCAPTSSKSSEDLTLYVLDIELIDEVTGKSPTSKFAIKPIFNHTGPILFEIPSSLADPDLYHVRVTWVQKIPQENRFEVNVEGYESYVADHNQIKKVSELVSYGGRYKHTVKLKPLTAK